MSTERWLRSNELFQEAVERPAEQRQAFLDASCDDDADLRREVESLLASHAEAGGFLETPALAEASARSPLGPAVAPGHRLGPYEIVAPIGSGAMGEVYRARDVRLGREVAVKVLPRELAGDPGRRERFEQEARAASALDHPNVVAVHDAGWHEGTPFIVTELLEGQTLAEGDGRLSRAALRADAGGERAGTEGTRDHALNSLLQQSPVTRETASLKTSGSGSRLSTRNASLGKSKK